LAPIWSVPGALRPVPEESALTTLRYAATRVGEELPALEVPITATAIVAGAIASRDYQDVHHDRELAVQRGSKDIFMNILGAPNYPGDVMKLSGRVVRKDAGVVTVEVRGANGLGDHVTGHVDVALQD
jgi:acyl dehydratase